MAEFNLRVEGHMKGNLGLQNVEVLLFWFLFYYPTICLKIVKQLLVFTNKETSIVLKGIYYGIDNQ